MSYGSHAAHQSVHQNHSLQQHMYPHADAWGCWDNANHRWECRCPTAHPNRWGAFAQDAEDLEKQQHLIDEFILITVEEVFNQRRFKMLCTAVC